MSKICCFTGHRPNKLSKSEKEVKYLLKIEVERAISEGFDSFISGMAMGFDIWAAETVLELREKYPNLQLICAVPYNGFERMRNADEKTRYRNILNKASNVCVLASKYSYSCFQYRNMWMVDRSQKVIAAFCGQNGGTKNTIEYAKNNKIEIVNIFDTLYETI